MNSGGYNTTRCGRTRRSATGPRRQGPIALFYYQNRFQGPRLWCRLSLLRERGYGEMRGDEAIFQHPKSWFLWIRYSRKGKLYRESTGTVDPKQAAKKLKDEVAEIRLDKAGKVVFVPNTQLRVRNLLDALEAYYRINQSKGPCADQVSPETSSGDSRRIPSPRPYARYCGLVHRN